MQLRIEWGGGPARQWHGTIAIDRGTLGKLRLLGDEADEPGSIWVADQRVEIRQRSVRRYDGFDLDVTAPSDAVLTVELREAKRSDLAPVKLEAPLRELARKPLHRELDQNGSRVLIRRSPGDMLKVVLHHDHLVFAPGETLRFDLEPRFLPAAVGASLQVRARVLSYGENGQEGASQEQAAETTAEGTNPARLLWEFKLPPNEGVYDVVIEAFEPPPLRFTRPKLLAQRRVQLVIVDDQMAPMGTDANAGWSRVMEIDPASSTWYERFRSWPLFSGLKQGPLGNGGIQTWQHPVLGAVAQLGPRGNEPDLHWEAYPLTISRPGVPHILEVEYPSDVPQTLSISVVEPNAAGWVVPIGLDSGFYVMDEPSEADAKWLRHRMIFWPRTSAPIALLANRRDGSRAVYGKIRVFAGPTKLPRMFAAGERSERMLAGYMSRPLLPENFGAAESLDLGSGRCLDDWRTFYDGATRLAEYLHHVGYGGQMLTVMAEGSAIYPSRHLEPTPRYDSGMFFDLGQDPMRKDALELTLRIFDREGLKLIPALQFDAPLPELEERLRRGGREAEGIRLIGPDGIEYAAKHPSLRRARPYYNPLNEHVQEAMLAVVREVAQRYGRHPSFAGLAIELSADGFAQLPGEAWGLDDATIVRFERETGIRVPGAGNGRFMERAQFLLPERSPERPRFADAQNKPQHQQWLNWRAEVMAEFYRRVQNELTGVRRDAVVYFAATNLFDAPEAKSWLRPSLPPRAQGDEVLLALGIQPDLFRQDRAIVLLRPQRVKPPGPVGEQALHAEFNVAEDLDAVYGRLPSTGCLLLHEPQTARLTSFEEKSPYGKEKTFMRIQSHLSPSGRRNRQRFVHALAAVDADVMFDGGWLLPLGQEESLADLVAAYRRLPTGKFETYPESTQPVTIRSQSMGNSTYAYLVNDSAWPMTVELQVDAPPGCRVDELSGRRRLPPLSAPAWRIELEPFDMLAMRFWDGNVKITNAQVLLNPQLQASLRQRAREFQQRLVMLGNPPPLAVPENADFEAPLEGDKVPGWSLVDPAAGTVAVGDQGAGPVQKPAGKQAIRFASQGPVAMLRSTPFTALPTGRVRILMWLRVDNAQRQPPLRLVIEDENGGQEYYRYGQVGLGQGVDPVTQEWTPFEFPVDDLPLGSTTRLRVGFDLMGPGEVWIDDIQMFDLVFEPKERLQFQKIATLASRQVEKGKLGECLHQLDNYWPRFINTYVPLPPPIAQQPGAKQPPKAAARPTNRWETWMDRWKR